MQTRQARILFRYIDKNNNGFLSYQEFYHFVKYKTSQKKIDKLRTVLLNQLGKEKMDVILARTPDPDQMVRRFRFLFCVCVYVNFVFSYLSLLFEFPNFKKENVFWKTQDLF